jgi:putative transcriptional regulator
MATEPSKPSRLARALLETADDMNRADVLSDNAREKITMRHLGEKPIPPLPSLSPNEIRAMRERAHMSQAVWARHLNLTVGYISQLERGAKHPTGPALVLLNVIQRKGIEAIL